MAPSFIVDFPVEGIEELAVLLRKLGFAGAEETAMGAYLVKSEYERMVRDRTQDIILSTCCPSAVRLVQKYYPDLVPCLAPVISPMEAHARYIKEEDPEAFVVFIGPCISKKAEAEDFPGAVDCVLTFEELTRWLDTAGVKLEQELDSEECSRARFFPTTGGILKTMALDAPGYAYLALDGAENCMKALRDIIDGKLHKCFIEMSICPGSCIGGPVMENRAPVRDYVAVSNYAGERDFEVKQPEPRSMKKSFPYLEMQCHAPTEAEINTVLRQMGKFKPSQELNCGSCGYNTCREKAIAVCQGKAEISMCLPFLKDKAEGFSDAIVNNTPNGLIVLNEDLEVQQINNKARKIMNIRSASDVLGEPVVRILDPTVFLNVLNTKRDVRDEKVYLAEYKCYVEQSVVYDRDLHLLIGIMRDITDEQLEREKKEDISRQTVEVADKVVEKQMRIVQDIASLLGETAAETKIALTKLKESITDE